MGIFDFFKKAAGTACAKCGAETMEFGCRRCGNKYCRSCLVSFGTRAAEVLIEIVSGGRAATFGSVKVFDGQGRAFCPNCYGGVVSQRRPPRAGEVEPTCVALPKT
ncbi:MAG: hypothetical protein L0387_01180 [Acidobacteria bacterium]|nr:hypothetical protein [Acidobacteriota bacterium]